MSRDSDESSLALLEALNAWGAIYGRKMNDAAIAAWTKLFRETPSKILSKALDSVTKEAKRMPTPGDVSEAVNKMYDAKGGKPSRLEANPDCTDCKGTGFKMVTRKSQDIHTADSLEAAPCKCRTEDEETQEFRASRRFVPAVGEDPETGAKVPVMIDKESGETLYSPQHCPEGRQFIAAIRKLRVDYEKGNKAEKRERRKAKSAARSSPGAAPLG
jgi:hypothetical protein